MATPLRVELAERAYDILAADGLEGLGAAVSERLQASRLAVISDSTVGELYGPAACESLRTAGFACDLLTFPAGEASKTLATVSGLYDRLVELGLDRKSAVIALGGGVPGDVAGFAAATWLRGIPFVQVPTSLLAMVDSSVGGKTGVDHPGGKNLIGAFHQPALVYAPLNTLATLPREELLSGLAEVVKHGVIRDPRYLATVEENSRAILALEHAVLGPLVAGSCRIKAEVVAADERESDLRAILNFGHTVGHALEKVTGYSRFRHGEAVSVGMIAACRLAETLLGFAAKETRRLEALLEGLGLPVRAAGIEREPVMEAMFGDKKTEFGTLRFVLPRRIGAVEILPVDDLDAVHGALSTVLA